MSHYHVPARGSGYVLETYFNPPGAHALALPGFVRTHADRVETLLIRASSRPPASFAQLRPPSFYRASTHSGQRRRCESALSWYIAA